MKDIKEEIKRGMILLTVMSFILGVNLLYAKCDAQNGDKPLKIVAFGDSIVAGSALPAGARNWTDILSEKYGTAIINAGIGGNTSFQGLLRVWDDVLVHKPDYVIINFGVNDSMPDHPFRQSVWEFRYNLYEMIRLTREAGAKPILMTPNPILEGDGDLYLYSRHDAALFEEYGGAQTLIDRYIDVIHDVARVTGTPLADVNAAYKDKDLYEMLITMKNFNSTDGVHPGPDGVVLYADVIGECLDGLMGE
jgi:lysophospholipase L1-like esterase